MFVVTLLTSPAQPMLERGTVESLRDAWGGGAAVWLAPGIAAEFPVDSLPGNFREVWSDLQTLGIDLAR
ncbi:phosphoserine phosphatase SerB, partial [Rhodovulum sulfidophilum]|nr:phosphoserine phosphatase SerB [Rhodovulum sulfidophilum]